MPFIPPSKPKKPAKPAPKKTKEVKVRYVKALTIHKAERKPCKVTYVEPEPVKPIEEDMPLNPLQMKWRTADGAVLLVALSYLGHWMVQGKEFKPDPSAYALKCEALGMPPGSARTFDLDALEELTRKVFHVYAKGQKPEKVSQSVYNLIFWPQFRGGFMFPDMGGGK